MQRTIGNRAVQGAVCSRVLQPRLNGETRNDAYENEVDHVDAQENSSSESALPLGGSSGGTDGGSENNGVGTTAGGHFASGTGLTRLPLAALQRSIGNHALARLLHQTIPAPASLEVRRKCACGDKDDLIQRDSDAPDQADQPPAAPPSAEGTGDDSALVSMATITVAGQSRDVHVEGGCDGLTLHGKTDASFDGGKGSVANQKVTKGEGCSCDQGASCIHLTGTLVTNYKVTVKITMPPMPGGLTACERGKVRDFLGNVLRPHELDHKARFETYNGQTRNPLDITGCGQADITKQVQAIQDAEEAQRQSAAQALSDAIDPFVRAIDCSDCQKQSVAPGAGQATQEELAAAAKRMSLGGDAALQRMAWTGSEVVARDETADQPADGGTAEGGTTDGGEVTNGEPDSAPSDGSPGQGLIVEDGVSDLSAGQMKKSDFLAQLRGPVSGAAQDALQGSEWEAAGSVATEPWFQYYASETAQQLEQSIRSSVPGAAGATDAGSYVPLISTQVGTAVKEWASSGTVPAGVPSALPGIGALGSAVSSLAQGAQSAISNIGGMLFKRREGAAQVSDHPAAVRAQLGSGEALDGGLAGRMASAFGRDFSSVRVHTDKKAAELAGNLNARAFTIGRDVAFGAGEYQPGTPIGDALIAHELAHVVQQDREAVQGPIQKGDAERSSLEEDADESAVQAVLLLWGGAKAGLANIRRNVIPALRSGLRLQRCKWLAEQGRKADVSTARRFFKDHTVKMDGELVDPDKLSDDEVVARYKQIDKICWDNHFVGAGDPNCLAAMAVPIYAGMTVGEILKGKKGSIKNAPLEPGSPSWDDIRDMTWEEIEANAKANKPGYRTIRKLLTDKRFDK